MKNYRTFISVFIILIFLPLQVNLPQNSKKTHRGPEAEKNQRNEHVLKVNTPGETAVFKGTSFDKETKNYFRVDHSGKSLWNGKHWDPEDFPLKVYVKTCNSDYFKSLYKNYIDYALGVWEQADSRIKFRYVSSESKADIVIVFEESLLLKYEDIYLGMTDYELSPERKIERTVIEVSLLKFETERLSDGEVKATIIHEIGHALGLGHSESESDIMFPFINPFTESDMKYNELSGGDIQAVRSVVDLGFKFILN